MLNSDKAAFVLKMFQQRYQISFMKVVEEECNLAGARASSKEWDRQNEMDEPGIGPARWRNRFQQDVEQYEARLVSAIQDRDVDFELLEFVTNQVCRLIPEDLPK
jgi:hypothetical protein